jgi:type III pantothenate kinase
MLLAIDAGNTNIVFALYEGDVCKGLWRARTDAARTADEYTAFLAQHFALNGLSFAAVKDVIVSSVVPDANFALSKFAEKSFGCTAGFIGKDIQIPDLEIKLDRPGEIGADRLVNTIAARTCYRAPAVVVDFGTATTFDVVDGSGAFCGGVIAPGPNLSLTALHLAAAKLPKIGVARPDRAIGKNTVEAMQSGVFWGYVGLVEGILSRIESEMGEKPVVIATGGLAPLFRDAIPCIDHVDEELTLKGLLAIYRQLKKQ